MTKMEDLPDTVPVFSKAFDRTPIQYFGQKGTVICAGAETQEESRRTGTGTVVDTDSNPDYAMERVIGL